MMRDVQARRLPEQITQCDKRSRSFMTTSGMKTFRVLQPTVNNATLTKYQSRPESPPQPRCHSTPLPRSYDRETRSGNSRRSSSSKRSISPRSLASCKDAVVSYCSCNCLFSSSPKPPALGSTCSSPVQYYRTLDSHHTRTFTPRSLSCTPPHLYMADHVRKAAVQLHRVSSSSSRQTIGSIKTDSTLDSSDMPTRFVKPVNLPTFVKSNPHLNNKELSMGQKQYLWGIARIYSMSHMKSQVQRQYQTLLDYEFKKRMERLGITEREKVKEMKDYLRYKKFIKNYNQRIPRNLRPKDRSDGSDHIHKHLIKGWTTDFTSRDKYSNQSTETEGSPEEVESQKDWEQTSERGAHIYKHVVKGWTMDPHANDAFQRDFDGAELRTENDTKFMSASDGSAVYRVDISCSGGKASVGGDLMKITRLCTKSESDQYLSQAGTEPVEVIVQAPGSNFL